MCAKSSTGRTQPSRREISTTSSSEPSSRTRPITSIPNGTARSFASSRSRSSPSCSQTESIASSRVRPSRKPGWKTTTSAPAAFAIPAEWSSIPTAMFSFLPRSAWPMKPAIGACTESTIPCSRASSPNARGEVVVHPEAALEVDLAGGVAALERAASIAASGLSCEGTRAGRNAAGSPCDGQPTLSVRPVFYPRAMAETPFADRPARARHRPPARRPLARGRRDRRVVARGRRRLHARGLRQGLLRRAHRGGAGLALRRSRLPRPGAPRTAHADADA